MSDAPYSTDPSSLRHVRWGVVLAGFVGMYAVGVAGGLALQGLGWWAGAGWERAVLRWAHGTTSPWLDPLFFVLPLFGTNYALVPAVAFVALWLWRPPGRLGTVLLVLLGSIMIAGAVQLVSVFVLGGSASRPLLSTLGVAGSAAAYAADRRWSDRPRRPVVMAHLVVVQLGSWVMNPALKFTVPRPRPDLFELRGQYGMPAYPSGHVIAVTSVLFTAAYLVQRTGHGRWGWWVAGVAWAATLYSRVYLSVHWPTDVIGGFLVGAVWLVAVALAFRPAHEAAGGG